MAEREVASLGEVLARGGGSIKTGPFGTVLKASEYASDGVPVISVGEVGIGRLKVSDKTPRVSTVTTARLPEYVLRAHDIVFGRKGAVDRSAWVSPDQDGWFLGSDGIRVRAGSAVSARFLAYQLQSPHLREWLLQHASGSTMASLNQPTLERVPLLLPPIGEQRAIAEVLGALDDKIAANTRLATTADRVSGAIYAAMLADGVEAPLSGLAGFVNGRAFTKGASGTGRVVVRIAELNSGIGGSTVYSDAEVADEHLARPGDMLFAWSGSLTLHRWFWPEAIVNQHIFKVIPRPDYPAWLVWHAISSQLPYFKSVAADKATTMGHIQRRHLDEAVSIPGREAVATHDATMTGLWNRALSAEREILTLAATRDALLPALMSGKLRVRDAERLVEDAL